MLVQLLDVFNNKIVENLQALPIYWCILVLFSTHLLYLVVLKNVKNISFTIFESRLVLQLQYETPGKEHKISKWAFYKSKTEF